MAFVLRTSFFFLYYIYYQCREAARLRCISSLVTLTVVHLESLEVRSFDIFNQDISTYDADWKTSIKTQLKGKWPGTPLRLGPKWLESHVCHYTHEWGDSSRGSFCLRGPSGHLRRWLFSLNLKRLMIVLFIKRPPGNLGLRWMPLWRLNIVVGQGLCSRVMSRSQ